MGHRQMRVLPGVSPPAQMFVMSSALTIACWNVPSCLYGAADHRIVHGHTQSMPRRVRATSRRRAIHPDHRNTCIVL